VFATSELRDIAGALRTHVSDLEPSDVPVAYAAQVFELFATIERLAASAKTLVACRVEEAGGYRSAGCRSTAEQLAKTSGTSISAATRMLETSRQLEDLPVVSDALRNGVLSAPAVEAIASAATVAPDTAEQLVETAKRSTFADVRNECLKARATGDREADCKRLRAGRYVRDWVDGEGAWNLAARGTVDEGARFRAAIEPIIDEIFNGARKADRREPRDAYAFDALIELVTRAPGEAPEQQAKPQFMAFLRLDYTACVRGDVADGEVCEIAGLGPIPVSTARELLGESILKLVITKGVDVVNVTHLGRKATIAQQVALWWRDPICTRKGCGNAGRLQIDHREDSANTNHTRFDELDRLSTADHDLKTRHGWELVAGTDRREMVPPDHPHHPKNRPKPKS
jgi:hypothetical protein